MNNQDILTLIVIASFYAFIVFITLYLLKTFCSKIVIRILVKSMTQRLFLRKLFEVHYGVTAKTTRAKTKIIKTQQILREWAAFDSLKEGE